MEKKKDDDGSGLRVPRGGGWGNEAVYCRSALRYGYSPSYRYQVLGFRPAIVLAVSPFYHLTDSGKVKDGEDGKGNGGAGPPGSGGGPPGLAPRGAAGPRAATGTSPAGAAATSASAPP